MVNCFHYFLSKIIFDMVHMKQTCWQDMWFGRAVKATSMLFLLQGLKHVILISLAIHTI